MDSKIYRVGEIPAVLSDQLGNPIDSVDSFISLAMKSLERGDLGRCREELENANLSIELTKERLHSFRTKKITFQ